MKFVKGLCHPINRTCLFNSGMYLISTWLVKKKKTVAAKETASFSNAHLQELFFLMAGNVQEDLNAVKLLPQPPGKKKNPRGGGGIKLFKCILCTSM